MIKCDMYMKIYLRIDLTDIALGKTLRDLYPDGINIRCYRSLSFSK